MTKFSKFLIKYDTRDDVFIQEGYEYVMDGHGKLVFNGREHWMVTKQRKYLISKRFTITDASTSIQIGRYKASDWFGSPGYKTKLLWEECEYRLREFRPNVRFSIFKRSTWGHKKYKLLKGDEVIEYSFGVDIPVVSLGSAYADKPFEGVIELNGASPVIALAGLLLVEQAMTDVVS